ncbi:MAG TPA: multiheme c-type cytochrome [Myxococcaceae bacterium]|nr:multiheme c-type cytochrome [Myxococcaceae bacterium]
MPEATEPFALQKTSQEREREISSLDERIELLKRELNAPGLGEQIKELKRAKLAELIERREAIASAPLPAEQGNLFALRFIPLEPALPSNAAVKVLLDDYDRQVGLLNLAWAQKHGRDCPRAAKGQAAYTGNEACQGCHAEAFPVWEASKHAQAYRTLEKLGRQYDLNCIGCHVTGYDRPGGVCRVDKVKNRTSVGCESCHGPGSIHSDDPDQTNVVAKPSKVDCVHCHNPENSPHFDFASFLPQILGPGHLGQKTSTPPKTR